MSEELHRLLQSGKRIYRRRRKFQGATWTPDTSSALAEDGPWCPDCRQRHGYMANLLGTKYEKRKDKFHILWFCRKTGNVLQDLELGKGK